MRHVSGLKSKRQVEVVRTYLKGKDIRYYLLFSLGVSSALRISDLLSLKYSDILEEDGTIKERVTKKEQKTGKTKRFLITRKSKIAINDFLEVYPMENMDQPLFFGRTRDKAISRQWARKVLSEAVKDCGINEPFGSHGLRKTWGTIAFKEGVPLDIIAIALNHRSIAATKAYLGIQQADIDKIAEKIDI